MSQQGQQIEPQPQPTMWGFDHTADGKFVVVIKQTYGGTTVDFISTDNITHIWQALRDQAKKCKQILAGESPDQIVVPSQVVLGPDGKPLAAVPPSQDVLDAMARHADSQAEQAAVDEVMGKDEDRDG